MTYWTTYARFMKSNRKRRNDMCSRPKINTPTPPPPTPMLEQASPRRRDEDSNKSKGTSRYRAGGGKQPASSVGISGGTKSSLGIKG